MPALGAGMDVGRIVEWYVKPGDRVERGDIIALVETDKANIDVEVFESGVVEELLVEEGTRVPIGTPVALIAPEEDAEPTPSAPPEVAAPTEISDDQTPEEPVTPSEAIPQPARAPEPTTEVVDQHPFVTSPLVRKQAAETGVDLTRVRGTGPEGLITRRDVTEAASAQGPDRPHITGDGTRPRAVEVTPPPTAVPSSPFARRLAAERGVDLTAIAGTGPGGSRVARDIPAATVRQVDAAVTPEASATVPPTAEPAAASSAEERALVMRQAIARAMEQANREIPHYHLGETVDVEDTLVWVAERNADRPPTERILPAALVLKATALALTRYPDLNGYWIDDGFRPGEGIHLGVAINLRRGGLLAPAIRDADQRSLDELMQALKDLVERTRAGGLRGSELTDPTITVSNLGDTGVESIHGVISPPQVALVGVGRITERPWVVDGTVAVRRTLFLSLAGDHRASDGHRGGRFLSTIATNLTRPETL